MKTRVWIASLAAGSLALHLGVGCVGDDPTPVVSGDVDSGTDTGPPSDGGVNDTGPGCSPAPMLFQPKPDAGPFCLGAVGGHCPADQHCCIDAVSNSQTCATGCDAGLVDIQCYNKAECATGVCCGNGTIDQTSCTYPVTRGFTGTKCESLCSGEFVECANSAECASKACTAIRIMGANNTTLVAQLGACL